MPFYEYRCTACQHQDSFLESIKAPSTKTCPQCGKRRAFKRLVSAVGFQLKGKGWYVTDFRDKNKPEKDGKAEGKGDGKAEDKSGKTEKTEKTEKPAADKKPTKTDGNDGGKPTKK